MHIIIGLDANDDVRDSPVQRMLTELGLKEAILDMHPTDPPETNWRNSNRKPIDGIFCTPGIEPTQGGYCAYKTVIDSDHRTLWIDVPFTSVLGHNPPNLHKHSIRAVRADDPRSVERYTSLVKQGYNKTKTGPIQNFQTLLKLRQDKGHLSDIIEMHARVLEESTSIKHWANNKSKRSFLGKYAWSPEWKAMKNPVLLWKKALKRFTGKVQPKYLPVTPDEPVQRAQRPETHQAGGGRKTKRSRTPVQP